MKMGLLKWLSVFFVVSALGLVIWSMLVNSFLITMLALFSAIIGAILAIAEQDDWS